MIFTALRDMIALQLEKPTDRENGSFHDVGFSLSMHSFGWMNVKSDPCCCFYLSSRCC